ncbi:NAD-dependent epimerase/dehydratase family protein [Rhodoplanes sp. TEM]|uniref:NAD-dependent epimerase/dehydratase family protein n=1 Tax=Rhodoplanes tepidamans TaxID=200616 RepID=A0ABT5JBA2_RHOTP|nr:MULTISPECIES: NAD-dependent epimerase/dehydratase family protein [Rhodoplanes]MDC7786961.1 NAD-dependent epimerase/dehydratase family protein [Rhodoplanes tepidamans]MDC7985048.1 NAD-dependent epimerase/dehydratase family protein [Rhodoplanes sp. TEM]MDQ0355342.1 UDP-glucose 4-epimerase [Rhodoplanes tepidamans]
MSARSAALPIDGRRFLIVGGASLVGSTTADLLLARGAGRVVLFDNFSFGSRDAVRHLVDDQRVTIVSGDVMRLPDLLAATEGVDGVLHLAAMMTISMDRDPWAGLDVNVRGAQNVIEACVVRGVGKLVFASSNAVYGYGPGVAGDLVEDTPFHAAGAPPAAILYGASKIVGEQLCRQAHQKRGLDYVVLRYSTVYGERQHYRAANALYIVETHDRIKAGLRPRVIGDGAETKHFVYVGDLARANAMAFEADASDVAVNVSGPEPVTTLQLVELVCELTGTSLRPEHVAPEAGKVRLTSGGAFRIDHAAAERAIGWRPEVGMREGLRRLLAWRDQAGAPAAAAE